MKKQLIFSVLLFAIFLSACSVNRSTKTTAIEDHYQPSSNGLALQAAQEPMSLPIYDGNVQSTQDQGLITPTLLASNAATTLTVTERQALEKKVVRIQQLVAKAQSKGMAPQITRKPTIVEKLVMKKVAKNMQKVRQQDDKQDFNSLDGLLKIGLVLLGVALLLAIFGLGLIGGLAALVALGFIVLGLLNTY